MPSRYAHNLNGYWSRGRKRQTHQTRVYTTDLRRLALLGAEWGLDNKKVIERLLDAVDDPASNRIVFLPDQGFRKIEGLAERLGITPQDLVQRVLHLTTALSPGELGKLILGLDVLPPEPEGPDEAELIPPRTINTFPPTKPLPPDPASPWSDVE